MTTFDTVASSYQQCAALQGSAAEWLFALLDIGGREDVLDLGCGPGGLTRRIRGLTAGRVAGVDLSAEMIAEAGRASVDAPVEFHLAAAEALRFHEEFDVVFCNSALQWFRRPAEALRRAHAALRPGGRIGIQAPATQAYCPAFLAAVESLRQGPETREVFARFRPPWTFLDTAADYAALLASAGFAVRSCSVETVSARWRLARVLESFHAGAAAGYLNPACYEGGWPEGFAGRATTLIDAAFARQAGPAGEVSLVFRRVYAVADKR